MPTQFFKEVAVPAFEVFDDARSAFLKFVPQRRGAAAGGAAGERGGVRE